MAPRVAATAMPNRVYPFRHMPRAADTAVFAAADGETLFGTGTERLAPVFCSIATHAPNSICRASTLDKS
jgi:hypothetical protein